MEAEKNPRILVITLEISENVKGNIIIHENDDPDKVSEDFLKKYNLDRSMKRPLFQVIQSHQEKFKEHKQTLHYKHLSQGNLHIRPLANTSNHLQNPSANASPPIKASNSSSKLNYGHILYVKGQEMKENKRQYSEKCFEETQKTISKNLTFHPKISKKSNKIVKNCEKDKKALKKLEHMNKLHADKEEQQMKECFFIPQISEKSNRIIENNNIFDSLYKDACLRRNSQETSSNTTKDPNKKNDYRRKSEGVEEFFDRLFTSKKKTDEEIDKIRQQYKEDIDKQTGQKLFVPMTGRKVSTSREKPIWDELYLAKIGNKDRFEDKKTKDSEKCLTQPSENNCKFYENFKFHRFGALFKLLDSDKDGKISREKICLDGIDTNVLVILKPIFDEMETDGGNLGFEDFLSKIDALYEKITPQDKMVLVKPRKSQSQIQFSFTPSINKKSQKLAANNMHLGNNIQERTANKKEITELKLKKARELQERGVMANTIR
ncbi:hypothetical protein SteCoe_13120 [Stentor coeruleus]|uniref:EF-hand domain-containing protein n=1 Tax=Stentor coeruleus TaxID=5963 RepID=A0A1R2C914_9CILI|nr:hypothetical protein SteCoe_13120 [Stentor coeruleus]